MFSIEIRPRLAGGVLMLLGALVSVAVRMSAQATDSQVVRLAAAAQVDRLFPLMTMFGERSAVRTLMPSPLGYRLGDGKMVMISPLPARPQQDSEELARALKAKVATPADTLLCNPPVVRGCSGTTGVQIRLSDPVIRGDSATVLFTLQALRRVNNEFGGVMSFTYALYLVREGGRWRAAAFGAADLRYLAEPRAIGPDGMPVTRD